MIATSTISNISPVALSAPDYCLSGGADGADFEWGEAALAAGHEVVHWTFANHRSKAQHGITVLSESQLELALPRLVQANKTLKRKIPRPGFVRNLLARNWYQVADAERVYAVASIVNGQVTGGTAWATQMFIDRKQGLPCACFVFDQYRGQWYCWKGDWKPIDQPPEPQGIYAAIGSRKLLDLGRNAIWGSYAGKS
jgi:hypothetical protein